jgi:hypothetical protein
MPLATKMRLSAAFGIDIHKTAGNTTIYGF